MAFALWQRGRLEEAAEVLEESRAQMLREAERQRRDLERLPALGFGDLYERLLAASRREDDRRALPAEYRPTIGWGRLNAPARRH